MRKVYPSNPARFCSICKSSLTTNQQFFCSTKCRGEHDRAKWLAKYPIRYCTVCHTALRPYQRVTCSLKCHGLFNSGENHPAYKGGFVAPNGYRTQSVAGRPTREHRLIMETYLGRHLLPTEVVHHIDGNPENNKIENLQLCASQSEHASLHRTTFISDTHKECTKCRQVLPHADYYRSTKRANSRCKSCTLEDIRLRKKARTAARSQEL
jgi:predicted nucleic acid-binding Zn ribbon protein